MAKNEKWTADQMPDQSGRVAIVTGANSGIGYEAARQLARHGATVIMACRNPERGEAAVAAIEGEGPAGSVALMTLDLADLSSVRAFAEAFHQRYDRLDLLINNAGVMMPPERWETKDGFEIQFGVNHLGHFALTGLLLDRLLETPRSRVVTVSSSMARLGEMNFDDLQGEQSYSGRGAYGQSKLANLLFTFELQRRLAAAGAKTLAVAAHPGYTATDLQRHSRLFRVLNPLVAQKPDKGALPTLYAAVGEDVQGGDYYGPDGFQEMRGHPKKVTPPDRATDEAAAARLWAVSEELTGVRFEIG